MLLIKLPLQNIILDDLQKHLDIVADAMVMEVVVVMMIGRRREIRC